MGFNYLKSDSYFTAYDILTGPNKPEDIKGVLAENLFLMFVRV